MSLVQIGSKKLKQKSFAIWDLGFRPFFLGGLVFSAISMLMWMAAYSFYYPLSTTPLSISQWHSHEMIYGYAMAIIVGFLLTAIVNWTGVQTVYGKSLFGLFALWVIPRVLFLFGTRFLVIASFFDLLFMICALIAITIPIVKSRSWKQLGIISKVLLLTLGNVCFYLGSFGFLEEGVYLGIYGSLYIIIALILTIGGRVMPAFISNGVGYEVEVRNPKWIIIANLVLFLGFFYSELSNQAGTITAFFAMSLFILNSYRLYLWHTVGIWQKPLLWSLYLSFVLICIGFLLYALGIYLGISKYIAIHAFGMGGMGLATTGMISRVTLGHTGRSIYKPPRMTGWAIFLLLIGIAFRVLMPLISFNGYLLWVLIAQIFWILAFVLLGLVYGRMLLDSRVDGKIG